MAFSPQGDLLASASGDTTVRIWDMDTDTPLHTLTGHKNWVLCVAWSPNGKYLASGGMDNDVWLWDPRVGYYVIACTLLIGREASHLYAI